MGPSNGRRVVRALEVIEITGRPFSASLPEPNYHYDRAVQIGVDIDRETLDRRIEQRVYDMWAAGFVDEVRSLAARACARDGQRSGRSATSRSWHTSTESSAEEEAKEQTVSRTRRFARRQDSWFRKDSRITWVRYDDPERTAKALDAIALMGRPATA